MKLFYAPETRSECVRWLLDELGVAYEIVFIDLANGEHKSDLYKSLHPLGQVPALEDEGIIIIERSAIMMHLIDRFRRKNLAPPPGGPERAIFYQWMVYAVATLEPAAAALFAGSDNDKAAARARFEEILKVVDDGIVGPLLFGAQITAADCLIGSQLMWVKDLGLLEKFPRLGEYVSVLAKRPAFKQVPKGPDVVH
jgi:glutathione S-transferase